MPLLTSDPLTQLSFAVSENKGVFAVLLGSGLSRAAEIPTGWEITLDLIRRVALIQGISEQSDWAQWYEDTVGEKPNYSGLLEELTSSSEERRAILHGYIEPMDGTEFSSHDHWSGEEFRARIQRYESTTEPLARMAGVLGRWGDDNELQLILDIIRTLYAHTEKERSGVTFWINLRLYPAVLILTAYGLGLTRAEQWPTLHALFSALIQRQYDESRRMVDLLFLGAWDGAERDLWKHVEGLGQRRTPFNDYLLTLMLEWSKSFASLSPNFELMFERFEVLGSLTHFERNPEVDLEAARTHHDILAWMPVGRIEWQNGNLTKLLQELQSETMNAALLEAGFACRRPRRLELFIENLKRFAGRMQFL